MQSFREGDWHRAGTSRVSSHYSFPSHSPCADPHEVFFLQVLSSYLGQTPCISFLSFLKRLLAIDC